jgi:glycosyltransferase involved in cell wall biosynthesis
VEPGRRLLVISSNPDGPGVRHRWLAFAPALAEAGIGLEVAPWPKSRRIRSRSLRRARSASGVVVASRLLAPLDAWRLRRRARRLAFDFDDALPFRDSSRGAGRSPTRSWRFRSLVRSADRVFAGNEYLAGLAADAGAGAAVLPTVVEVPPGAGPDEPPPEPPVVGWIGARTTLPYLESLAVVLSAVVGSGRALRMRAVADAVPVFPPGIAVEAVPWTLEGWRRELARIHLGVAPLPDDPWTRGKCGLKVLQMLSVARPVVASAVGVQREQVLHGETGFLASTPAEFVDGIVALLDDPERRRRMGEAALRDARRRWSVEAWTTRVLAEVQHLLA